MNQKSGGHGCLANLVQGTVCKILGQEEVKPHKVRYHLERRDADFEQKMAEVLCVYREASPWTTASSVNPLRNAGSAYRDRPTERARHPIGRFQTTRSTHLDNRLSAPKSP
jgi:hypothetical protein